MTWLRFTTLSLILLLLAACTVAEPGAPPPSAPPATSTALPEVVPPATSTALPEVIPPATPTVSPTTPLDAFVDGLKLALLNQEYASLQAMMRDPIAIGGWRSEWRELTPEETIAGFQSGSVPAPFGVQATGLDEEGLTALLGQPPASFFSPETRYAAALHTTGWGQSSSDEAILFITETDEGYVWHALLYTQGRFADAYLNSSAAPAGLIYSVADQGVFRVTDSPEAHQLLDAATAATPNLRLSPDGRHAAYLTAEQALWLIATSNGEQTQLAAEFTLSPYLAWGNAETLLVGVWLNSDEAGGPNNGHIATLNINDGTLQMITDQRLSAHRPSLAPDGRTVAFDLFPTDDADLATGWIYDPSQGLERFDRGRFTTDTPRFEGPLFNPAWSPDGQRIAWLVTTGDRLAVQQFNLVDHTASQLFDWDPARFGALLPAPVWSPDGQWLLLEVWTNGLAGGGIWLLPVDGRAPIQIDYQGRDPHWLDATTLVFGVNGSVRLYDITTAETTIVDLPSGSWPLGVAPAN